METVSPIEPFFADKPSKAVLSKPLITVKNYFNLWSW